MAKNAIHKSLFRIWARLGCKKARRSHAVSRWTATVAYSVLALGIPLPMPSGKASKELFPCMNHHCGCQSAEECWRNCCCMTLEERLIWARENHVQPPEYALAEARAKGIEWAMNWPGDEHHQNSIPCVAVRPADEESDCQQGSGQCPCGKPAAHECACCACQHCTKAKPCERQSENGILLMNALKCHGVGDNWPGMVISMPAARTFQFHFCDQIVGKVSFIASHFSSVSSPPDVPPPRFLVRG